MQAAILYLDFDGVLHPDAVYVYRGRGIVLMSPGHSLFEGVPILETIVTGYPSVSIVLSTSWVHALDFDRAKRRLSPALQAKVIGATFHRRHMSAVDFQQLPRSTQILSDAQRRGASRWVALDDNDEAWPPEYRSRLVLTDSHVGLLDHSVQLHLRDKLDEMTQ